MGYLDFQKVNGFLVQLKNVNCARLGLGTDEYVKYLSLIKGPKSQKFTIWIIASPKINVSFLPVQFYFLILHILRHVP